MIAEYSEDRDYLLRFSKWKELVGQPYPLLECTKRFGLDPYNAALLMCPVDPQRSSGYAKLIDYTIDVFERFKNQRLGRDGSVAAGFAASILKKIWGLDIKEHSNGH